MMKRERKGDKSETEQKKNQACLNTKLPKSLLKSFNKPDSKSHHKLSTIEDLKDSVKPLFDFFKTNLCKKQTKNKQTIGH